MRLSTESPGPLWPGLSPVSLPSTSAIQFSSELTLPQHHLTIAAKQNIFSNLFNEFFIAKKQESAIQIVPACSTVTASLMKESKI